MSVLSKLEVKEDLANNKKSIYNCLLERGAKYQGVGNDEYKSYVTLDNGETWDIIPEDNDNLIGVAVYPIIITYPGGTPKIIGGDIRVYPPYISIPPEPTINITDISIEADEDGNTTGIRIKINDEEVIYEKPRYKDFIISTTGEDGQGYNITITATDSDSGETKELFSGDGFSKGNDFDKSNGNGGSGGKYTKTSIKTKTKTPSGNLGDGLAPGFSYDLGSGSEEGLGSGSGGGLGNINDNFGNAPYNNYSGILKDDSKNIIILYSDGYFEGGSSGLGEDGTGSGGSGSGGSGGSGSGGSGSEGSGGSGSGGSGSGGQLIYSNDGGLTWYDVNGLKGVTGPFNNVVEDDDGWYLSGNNGNVYIDKNGNGKVTSMDGIDIAFEDLNLLYVINKVIVPELSFKLTGNNIIQAFSKTNLNDVIQTHNSQTLKGIYTNLNSFDTMDVNYSDMFIDWENDFDMRPLDPEEVFTFSNEVLSSVPLYYNSETSDLKDNEVLSKTIEDINNYLNARKKRIKQIIINKYNEADVDSEELLEGKEESSEEDFVNACKLLSLYRSVTIHSITTVVSTLLDAVFYFDNNKMKNLIIAAIYETVLASASAINFSINTLKDKAIAAKEEPEKYKDIQIITNEDGKDFVRVSHGVCDFKYDFNKGLMNAVSNYLDYSFKSIIKLTTNNDEDLVTVASTQYKYKHSSIIKEIEDCIIKVSVVENINTDDYSNDKSYESIKTIFDNAWNQYKESVRKALDDLDLSKYKPDKILNEDQAKNARILDILDKAFIRVKERAIQLLDLVRNNDSGEVKYSEFIHGLESKELDEKELKKEIEQYINNIFSIWKSNKGKL